MRKRLLSVLLAWCMVLTTICTEVLAKEPYTDAATSASSYAAEKDNSSLEGASVYFTTNHGLRLTSKSDKNPLQSSNTDRECSIQGYYTDLMPCTITFSDAVVEKREVLVRDIHDEFEPFEKQSITFIVLQPGSKVIVPPNPNNKDPEYSEAICDGGAVCLENGVYELEWSGGIVGFSSQTAEEFTDSGASITFFETDQFNTELCFVVLESQSAVSSSTGFTDVKATDFFAKPVKWALEHQITGGISKTQFSPQQPCSVSQILTFLYRASGSPEAKINNPFSDVSPSN